MLSKIRKNNKGFTLIELTVVVAIIGLLMAIAVPKIGSVRKRAAITAHNVNVRALTTAANMYLSEYGVPGTTIVWDSTKKDNEGGWGAYLQEWPDIPNGLSAKDFGGSERPESYKVTIDENGNIKVEPDEILDKEENNK